MSQRKNIKEIMEQVNQTCFKTVISFVNTKGIGEKIYRKDMLELTRALGYSDSTVDGIRRMLAVAKFLLLTDSGEYKLTKKIPSELTSSSLRTLYSKNTKAEGTIWQIAQKLTEFEMNNDTTAFLHHSKQKFYKDYMNGVELAEDYLSRHSLLTDDIAEMLKWSKSGLSVKEYVDKHKGSVISKKFGF